jgi:hypothetical protein
MVMPLPKNPGESAAAFAAREAAYLESLRKRGLLGPKDKDKPKPKPRVPVQPPRGGGSSPVRVMPGKTPMRVTGGMGMKRGGMVKGKKK